MCLDTLPVAPMRGWWNSMHIKYHLHIVCLDTLSVASMRGWWNITYTLYSHMFPCSRWLEQYRHRTSCSDLVASLFALGLKIISSFFVG